MSLVLYTQKDRNDDDVDAVWDAGSVVGSPWLFVGSLSAAESLKMLQINNVTRVLTVARDLPLSSWSTNADDNIQHLIVEIDDHPNANFLAIAEKCWTFINDAAKDYQSVKNQKIIGKSVGPSLLVHCASGVSRSVTAIVTWLMTHQNLSSEEALTAIKQHRPFAKPNSGFKAQIDILQKQDGNVDRSLEEWKSITATDRIEKSTQLLLTANEIHGDVDNLEVQTQSFVSRRKNEECSDKNCEPIIDFQKEVNCLLQEAGRLCGIIDKCGSFNSDILLTKEKVAKLILKSARSKLEHLIKVITRLSKKDSKNKIEIFIRQNYPLEDDKNRNASNNSSGEV